MTDDNNNGSDQNAVETTAEDKLDTLPATQQAAPPPSSAPTTTVEDPKSNDDDDHNKQQERSEDQGQSPSTNHLVNGDNKVQDDEEETNTDDNNKEVHVIVVANDNHDDPQILPFQDQKAVPVAAAAASAALPNATTMITTTNGDKDDDDLLRRQQQQRRRRRMMIPFDSFLDVQTRLILLPRVEEDATGAVVHSYIPRPMRTRTTPPDEAEEKKMDHPSSSSSSSAFMKEEEEDVDAEYWTGKVLIGVGEMDSNDPSSAAAATESSFLHMDFTDILSAIREYPSTPIPLYFGVDPEEEEVEEEEEEKEHDTKTKNEPNKNNKPSSDALVETAAAASSSSSAINKEQKAVVAVDLPNTDVVAVKTTAEKHYLPKNTTTTTNKENGVVVVVDNNNDDDDGNDESDSSDDSSDDPTKRGYPKEIEFRPISADQDDGVEELQTKDDTTAIFDNNNNKGHQQQQQPNKAMKMFSNWSGRLRKATSPWGADGNSNNNNTENGTKPKHQESSMVATKNNNESTTTTTEPINKTKPKFAIYLQTPNGKLEKLVLTTRKNGSMVPPTKKQQNSITTSSVLMVRNAETGEGLSTKTHTFQWYRSKSSTGAAIQSSSKSTESGAGAGATITTTTTTPRPATTHNNNTDAEWSMLTGASHAAYQPTALDIGCFLRCSVTTTITLANGDETKKDGDNNEGVVGDGQGSNVDHCDTIFKVVADRSMLNGARTALGVKFQHFRGLPPLTESRTFSIGIDFAPQKQGASLSIDQVAGSTAEPLHSDPILYADVMLVDASNPKELTLKIPKDSIQDTDMLSALCVTPEDPEDADEQEDGMDETDALTPTNEDEPPEYVHFHLQAPNRMTRETFLLALGIANFLGKPADLDISSVLYPPPKRPEIPPPSVTSSIGRRLQRGTSFQSESGSIAGGGTGSTPVATATQRTVTIRARSPSPMLPMSPPSMKGSFRDFLPPRAPSPAVMMPNPRAPTPSSVVLKPNPAPAPPANASLSSFVSNSTAAPGDSSFVAYSDRIREMSDELKGLNGKLQRKDKFIAELQRQLAYSDGQLARATNDLTKRQEELSNTKQQWKTVRKSFLDIQTQKDQQERSFHHMAEQHAVEVSRLQKELKEERDEVATLAKTVRVLQNEKAVMSAAVEARDGKIEKMSGLRFQVSKLQVELDKGDAIRKSWRSAEQKCDVLEAELLKTREEKEKHEMTLEEQQRKIRDLESQLASERKRTIQSQTQLKSSQEAGQKVKAERNNYKQKADSLQKEISRLCRRRRIADGDGGGGSSVSSSTLTLRDIERILENEEARKTEVEILKAQKRKALEDLHEYRTAYQQSLVSQLKTKKSTDDVSFMKLQEQKLELERLVAHLTEYVNAKEMQLDTMKEVNQTLQDELRALAKANMDKNDI